MRFIFPPNIVENPPLPPHLSLRLRRLVTSQAAKEGLSLEVLIQQTNIHAVDHPTAATAPAGITAADALPTMSVADGDGGGGSGGGGGGGGGDGSGSSGGGAIGPVCSPGGFQVSFGTGGDDEGGDSGAAKNACDVKGGGGAAAAAAAAPAAAAASASSAASAAALATVAVGASTGASTGAYVAAHYDEAQRQRNEATGGSASAIEKLRRLNNFVKAVMIGRFAVPAVRRLAAIR